MAIVWDERQLQSRRSRPLEPERLLRGPAGARRIGAGGVGRCGDGTGERGPAGSGRAGQLHRPDGAGHRRRTGTHAGRRGTGAGRRAGPTPGGGTDRGRGAHPGRSAAAAAAGPGAAGMRPAGVGGRPGLRHPPARPRAALPAAGGRAGAAGRRGAGGHPAAAGRHAAVGGLSGERVGRGAGRPRRCGPPRADRRDRRPGGAGEAGRRRAGRARVRLPTAGAVPVPAVPGRAGRPGARGRRPAGAAAPAARRRRGAAARPHPSSTRRLGNQVGVIPIEVPAAGDPVDRLPAIVRASRARKAAPRGASAALLAPAFRFLARLGVLGRLIGRQRLVNTFVTNLPGPSHRLSFLGAPITEVIPVSGTTGNVTVAFAVLSYAGTLVVTLVADPDRCPDLPVLAVELQTQLDTLAASRTAVPGAGTPG